jgi:hypothetical protein
LGGAVRNFAVISHFAAIEIQVVPAAQWFINDQLIAFEFIARRLQCTKMALARDQLGKFSGHSRPHKNNRHGLYPNGVVMSKNRMLLTLVLFVGCGSISQAHPLDSPDTVYIDGLPCNSACQAYMSWSRQRTSSMTAAAQAARRASAAIRGAATMRRHHSETVSHAGVARQAIPLPPTRTAELPPAGKAAAASELARGNVAASPPVVGAAAAPRSRTIQERVAAATALAEQVTIAAFKGSDAERPASMPTNKADEPVALVMARPEIKSVADLAGKDVAIEEQQSASGERIRSAMAASGAAAVQLSPGYTKPIDRLIGGEVPAAVLTLVSTEAAEWFPDISGFRIFRVPLPPR